MYKMNYTAVTQALQRKGLKGTQAYILKKWKEAITVLFRMGFFGRKQSVLTLFSFAHLCHTVRLNYW